MTSEWKKTVSTRLPGWLEADLQTRFSGSEGGLSGGLRRIVLDWWTRQEFPALEFREPPAGGPAIRGGPELWQLEAVAGGEEQMPRVERYFGPVVEADALRQAVNYLNLVGGVESGSRREADEARYRPLKKVGDWQTGAGVLLLGWSVAAPVEELLARRDVEAAHVGRSEDATASTSELLKRCREREMVLVSADYAGVWGAVSGGKEPVAVLEPGLAYSREAERVASAIAEWSNASTDEAGRPGPWIETPGGE